MTRFIAILLVSILPFLSFASETETGGKESSKPNAQVDLRTIPFTLPDAVVGSIEQFASECDILALGEVHGTQEVPLIALALMTPLSKLGYGTLALEIPRDQQAPLIKMAAKKTKRIPDFFSKPIADGRGNAQLLSLIRIAASPPFGWKIICFDRSMLEAQRDTEEFNRILREEGQKATSAESELTDAEVVFWQKRDAAMASNLAVELKKLQPRTKVLAICGRMHNRIENNSTIPEHQKLWPSFASVLQRDNPDWKLGSVNILFQSGGFYNGGKIRKFPGQATEQAEARPPNETGYHWELKLPVATPATFLATPSDVR